MIKIVLVRGPVPPGASLIWFARQEEGLVVSVVWQLLEELPERGWHGAKRHRVVAQEVINGDPLILSDGSLIHCEVAEDAVLR